MLRRGLAVLGAALALAALPFVVAYALIETGEVVVLRTPESDGGELLARLWVVDHDGNPWISTIDPTKTRWVARLEDDPRILLVRDGERSCRDVRFNRDPTLTKTLNAALREKYRLPWMGSAFLRRVAGAQDDPARRVWIRLLPCPRTDQRAAKSRSHSGSARKRLRAKKRLRAAEMRSPIGSGGAGSLHSIFAMRSSQPFSTQPSRENT